MWAELVAAVVGVLVPIWFLVCRAHITTMDPVTQLEVVDLDWVTQQDSPGTAEPGVAGC